MRRRDFLKLAAGSAFAIGMGRGSLGYARRAGPQSVRTISPDEKFFFVVTATGGGAMTDAFHPMLPNEVTGSNASNLATYSESQVAKPSGSNLRCVKRISSAGVFQSSYSLETLLAKHAADMVLIPVDNTSVNHVVAQKRAVTGSNINAGRTIMEAVAMRIGQDKLIANCNMGSGGYIAAGDDPTVPDWARSELINSPILFPLSTDGMRGLRDTPSRVEVEHGRSVRAKLDQISPFAAAHAQSGLRKRFLELRDQLSLDMMSADLITKLMVIPDASSQGVAGGLRLSERDLESSPDGQKIWSAFPNVMTDALHAQGALAFLLARTGVSSVITLGPSSTPAFLPDGTILGTPISFDYSHVDHLAGQNVMWSRVGAQLDGLITLLKNEPLGTGSMWDRSLIYVATDFGRGKQKAAGARTWSSPHELNNANLFISPMLKGNRLFGGIDPTTMMFYGFDRRTGEPAPGTMMREGDLYSLVAHVFDVGFGERTDMTAVLR
jgi:hypothetical protein